MSSGQRVYACVNALRRQPCAQYDAGACSSSHDQAVLARVPFCRDGAACSYREKCYYVHGDLCECGDEVLHPFNESARELHFASCRARNVPLASLAGSQPSASLRAAPSASRVSLRPDTAATDRESAPLPSSKAAPVDAKGKGRAKSAREDAECSICFENVLEQGNIFGLLESCTHTFCLPCIKAWRKPPPAKSDENGVQSTVPPLTLRSCPICRTLSLFVVPSRTWPGDEEEKKRVIESYKNSRSRIECKHFIRSGRKRCPFGDECFYLHLDPATGQRKVLGVGARVSADGSHRDRFQARRRRFRLESGSPWTSEELRDVISVLDGMFQPSRRRFAAPAGLHFLDSTGVDWSYEDDEDFYEEEEEEDDEEERRVWWGNRYESDPESDDEDDAFVGSWDSSGIPALEAGSAGSVIPGLDGLLGLLDFPLTADSVRRAMDVISSRLVEAGLSADDEDVVALVDLVESLAHSAVAAASAGSAATRTQDRGDVTETLDRMSLGSNSRQQSGPLSQERPISVPAANIYASPRSSAAQPQSGGSAFGSPASPPSGTFEFRFSPGASVASTLVSGQRGRMEPLAKVGLRDVALDRSPTAVAGQARRASEVEGSGWPRPAPLSVASSSASHPYAPIPYEDVFGSSPRGIQPDSYGSTSSGRSSQSGSLEINPFTMMTMRSAGLPPHLPTPPAPPLITGLDEPEDPWEGLANHRRRM